MKQIVLLIISLLALYSCSSLNNNIAPGYTEAYKNIKSLFMIKENIEITPSLIEEIPYASAMLRIGKAAPGLIILEGYQRDEQFWISADNVYISIAKGRVVATRGLPNNLIEYKSSFSLYEFQDGSFPKIFYSYYSYDLPELINLKVRSSISVREKEVVDLFNQQRTLLLIEEEVSNDYLGWKETNKYWLDEEGFVWKSVQNLSPKLPPFEIIITKKPAK